MPALSLLILLSCMTAKQSIANNHSACHLYFTTTKRPDSLESIVSGQLVREAQTLCDIHWSTNMHQINIQKIIPYAQYSDSALHSFADFLSEYPRKIFQNGLEETIAFSLEVLPNDQNKNAYANMATAHPFWSISGKEYLFRFANHWNSTKQDFLSQLKQGVCTETPAIKEKKVVPEYAKLPAPALYQPHRRKKKYSEPQIRRQGRRVGLRMVRLFRPHGQTFPQHHLFFDTTV